MSDRVPTAFLPPGDPDRDGGRKVTLFTRSPKGVKIRDERVRRLSRRIMVALPWLTIADRDLIRAYCQVQILSDECFAKIRAEGVARQNGQPHPLLNDFRSLIRVQADLAGRLGLSPRDRAVMQSNSTTAALDRVDLTRVERILRARGRTSAAVEDAVVEEEVNANDVGSAPEGNE